jgi:hypothetical protein
MPASGNQNGDIAQSLETWWNSLSTFHAESRRMTGFKWNAIGPDGKFADPSLPNTYQFATPLKGTSGNQLVMPLQIAAVVTTRTGRKGKSYNGRIYTPGPVSSQAGPYWDPTYMQTLKAVTANLLTDLNQDVSGTGTRACIVSNAGNPGPVTLITHVTVGRVPDTVRRRRNALTEEYSALEPV